MHPGRDTDSDHAECIVLYRPATKNPPPILSLYSTCTKGSTYELVIL